MNALARQQYLARQQRLARQQHLALLSISEAQHGLITATQARYLLGSTSAALSLAHSGDWERVSKVLFRRRDSAATFQQRCLAAVLDLGGDTVVSHESALALFARTDAAEAAAEAGGESAAAEFAAEFAAASGEEGSAAAGHRLIHVSSTSTKRRPDALATVHRVARLPDRWRTIHRGIPVAAPALIAMQLFAVQPTATATAIVDDMVARGLVRVIDLEAVVTELGERGRTGTGALRSYLAGRRSGVRGAAAAALGHRFTSLA
ncbi:MAG: hypothetical protein GX868_11070 [Actinobacteria bacterium]|nr:hypothetical protein [Actinomycetota bacterium]